MDDFPGPFRLTFLWQNKEISFDEKFSFLFNHNILPSIFLFYLYVSITGGHFPLMS
jgi:hypothetical protein